VLHHQRTGEIIISVLLLQDIIAIFLLLALEGSVRADAGWIAMLKPAIAFPAMVVAAYLLEKYVLMRLIARFDRIQEYIFLLAIAWCLGMAEVAEQIGLSYEIGAFIAGVSIARSPIALFIAESLKPLRDFFLIIFFVALGAVEWLTMARIVRGQTLSVRQKEFIEAAHASGVSTFNILRKHVIPNVLGPVIVYVTLTIPQVILTESFLSFLGLGVQEPLTSWGVLISEGARQMEEAPWLLIFPAVFLGATLFCFNFIGDGLRDALDPKDR